MMRPGLYERLHLPASAPNEGARRLAWWIGSHLGGLAAARASLRNSSVDAGVLDRLLSGELEPGADLSYAISLVTDGFASVRDWREPAQGGWFDRPALRERRAAA